MRGEGPAGAKAKAAIAIIGVVSEGGDMDGTDAAAVRRRVVGRPAKRGVRDEV